jgi:hypothetical protein
MRALVSSTTRPSSMYELVGGPPPYTGATDAAKAGMGGVWFIDGKALLWRTPFPAAVQNQLVSYNNPTATITNSDLELLGTIAHHHILEEAGYPMAGESTHTFSDNTPALAWQTKGSATTTKVTADLLRHSALHQQATGHVPAYEHLAGVKNVMADDASRLGQLDDTHLLSHFNSHYPQIKSWQMRHLSPQKNSELISLLCRPSRPLESPTSDPKPSKSTGGSGSTFATAQALIPASSTSAAQSLSYKSSCGASAMGDSRPVVDPSQLDMLRTRSAQWARRWPSWGPATTGRTHARAS